MHGLAAALAAFYAQDAAALLLDRGADRLARDRSFDATPQQWATHEGHAAVDVARGVADRRR